MPHRDCRLMLDEKMDLKLIMSNVQGIKNARNCGRIFAVWKNWFFSHRNLHANSTTLFYYLQLR